MPEPGALPALTLLRFVGVDHGACPDGRLDLDVGWEQGLGGALLQDGDRPQAHTGLGTEERERGLLDLARESRNLPTRTASTAGNWRPMAPSTPVGSGAVVTWPQSGQHFVANAYSVTSADRRQVHDLSHLRHARLHPGERPLDFPKRSGSSRRGDQSPLPGTPLASLRDARADRPACGRWGCRVAGGTRVDPMTAAWTSSSMNRFSRARSSRISSRSTGACFGSSRRRDLLRSAVTTCSSSMQRGHAEV